MESSWSYVSDGKVFTTNDVMSTSERKMPPWWSGDSRAPSGFGNGVSGSGFSLVDNQGLGLIGYQDFDGRQLHGNSVGDFMSSRVHGGRIISPYTGLEDRNSSRLSGSIVDSVLQLGVFGDPRDSQSSRVSGNPLFGSSLGSYMPPRRTRMGVNCNAAYCQVYGCNKDLSSSKDYHKRHKVCEAHSKTAKVIVNGIEQRFCQQCSRFHLLAEFDDGKRSCRKRLAGHNQRRRKPQVGFHSGRTGRLLHGYNADPYSSFENGRFHGTELSPTSFVCSDLLPSGLMQHPERYKPNDWSSRIKVEQGASCSHVSAVPMSNWNLPSRLIFAENRSFFDAATTIQGVSGIQDSTCALSLLSSQSTNSHYSIAHVSEKLMGVSSLTSSSSIPIPESNETINFDIADQFCCEAGGTINLLQREFENQSMQVKHETNACFCLNIT